MNWVECWLLCFLFSSTNSISLQIILVVVCSRFAYLVDYIVCRHYFVLSLFVKLTVIIMIYTAETHDWIFIWFGLNLMHIAYESHHWTLSEGSSHMLAIQNRRSFDGFSSLMNDIYSLKYCCLPHLSETVFKNWKFSREYSLRYFNTFCVWVFIPCKKYVYLYSRYIIFYIISQLRGWIFFI